jgi:hypothetical protein
MLALVPEPAPRLVEKGKNISAAAFTPGDYPSARPGHSSLCQGHVAQFPARRHLAALLPGGAQIVDLGKPVGPRLFL